MHERDEKPTQNVVQKPERKRPLERYRHRLDNNEP
jgi:hypothetical protein